MQRQAESGKGDRAGSRDELHLNREINGWIISLLSFSVNTTLQKKVQVGRVCVIGVREKSIQLTRHGF